MIGDDVSIIFELNNCDSYKIQGRHVITESTGGKIKSPVKSIIYRIERDRKSSPETLKCFVII